MSDSGSSSSTSDSSSPGSPGESAFMAVVLLVMFGCLFTGWKTPETVVFLCLVLTWNVGLVGTTEALSGFSNAGMLAVGALFVVIKGVEKSQLADKAARQVFGLRTSLSAGLARMMSLCFVLSAFLNNTPVVALLIPITRDWARARGFSPSTFLIPLSYSCIMGGLLTVIGTSTNLVVQGLVLDEAKTDPTIEAIGFFEPGYVGVPLGILGMAYLVVFAPRVLPSCGGLFRYVRDRAKELLTEVQVMDDFPYIGEPAGLVLVRLGLPQDTLIKIRRRIPSGILRQMSATLEGKRGTNLFQPSGASSTAPVKDGGGGGGGVGSNTVADTNALMEANQKTLRAECMYSYRLRSECLWGTAEDAEEKSVTPAPRPARRSGSFTRKRWASDADRDRAATEGNAAAAAANADTCAKAIANATANATASTDANGAGVDKDAASESSERETYTDIFPVSPAEPVQAGDVLFLSCAQATMIDFQSVTVSQGLRGLKFLDVSALDLPGHGTEFFEIVLSDHNHFVGRSADRDNSEFAAYYGCSVVAVRRRGHSGAVAPSAASAPATASRGGGGGASSVAGGVAGSGVAGGGGDGGGGGGGGGSVDNSTSSAARFKGSSRVTDAPEVFLEEGISSEPAFDPSSEPPTPASARVPEKLTAASPRSPPRATRSRVRSIRSPLRSLRKEASAPEGDDVTGLSFKAGDVVLVLAKEEFMEKYSPSKDFFLLTKVGSVPKPVRYYDYLPLLAFLGMLIWVLFDADMVQASFAAGAVLILGGWVDAKKTVGYIDWSLLLLIGSALGLSKGIVNSGLANYVGGAIRDSGISADASLFVLYIFTMLCTELITNNAAAALATPIAFSISRELDVSYKPFILTVMLAASSSFITPIGYQTNTLVWGPGGYRFTDFMKIGTPLSLIYLVLGCLLVPRIFPF